MRNARNRGTFFKLSRVARENALVEKIVFVFVESRARNRVSVTKGYVAADDVFFGDDFSRGADTDVRAVS